MLLASDTHFYPRSNAHMLPKKFLRHNTSTATRWIVSPTQAGQWLGWIQMCTLLSCVLSPCGSVVCDVFTAIISHKSVRERLQGQKKLLISRLKSVSLMPVVPHIYVPWCGWIFFSGLHVWNNVLIQQMFYTIIITLFFQSAIRLTTISHPYCTELWVIKSTMSVEVCTPNGLGKVSLRSLVDSFGLWRQPSAFKVLLY